jgi:hypothetical protein
LARLAWSLASEIARGLACDGGSEGKSGNSTELGGAWRFRAPQRQ